MQEKQISSKAIIPLASFGVHRVKLDIKQKSVFFVSDVLYLCGIKEKIANGCNQTVDTKGDQGQENVRAGSGRIAFGLEAGVVDNQATNPSKEKGKQKTNEIVVLHVLFLQKLKLKRLQPKPRTPKTRSPIVLTQTNLLVYGHIIAHFSMIFNIFRKKGTKIFSLSVRQTTSSSRLKKDTKLSFSIIIHL